MRGVALRALAAAAILALCASAAATQDLGDCPAPGASWTTENLKQCIDDFARQIEQSAPQSQGRVALLAKRAQARRNLGAHESDGDKLTGPHFEAALADYAAALSIAPRDAAIRYKRAQLLLDVERPDEALSDAEILTRDVPDSVRFQLLKGWALSQSKRHKEAIAVYTHAIELAQSCAEASLVQRKINAYRHAFDPPPTREEAMSQVKSMPLYDAPEPGVTALGFACKPSAVNSFNDLVTYKSILFQGRADSHRALSNPWAALRDFEYAASISFVPELVAVQLCELRIDLSQGFTGIEHCRQAFDGDTVSVLSDPILGAKMGRALLKDGDLKGACRLAFPFVLDKRKSDYVAHAEIKALRKRTKAATEAAGATCEKNFE